LRIELCLPVQRNCCLEVLKKDGVLVIVLLWLISDVGRKDSVIGQVEVSLIEMAIKDKRLEVVRLIVSQQGVRVCYDKEALFPRVAWLDVLNVVLRIEHKCHFFVSGQLVVLVGESNEGIDHAHLDE
jgi:hypothetical protein